MFKFINSGNCYNGGKRHNFEPRFHSEEQSPSVQQIAVALNNTMYRDTEKVVGALITKKKTYIHDICIWCGEIRK